MSESKLEGAGVVVGKRALNFVLDDHLGNEVSLKDVCAKGPVMLVFYPGDFTLVCTKQLCNYRDTFAEFSQLGIRILGISKNAVEDHQKFAQKYSFPFQLLSDPQRATAKQFGCTSALMLGGVSRAVFILNEKMMILYRYVEPTVLTHRTASELVAILKDLRTHKLI